MVLNEPQLPTIKHGLNELQRERRRRRKSLDSNSFGLVG
jgi:hypothetical protein